MDTFINVHSCTTDKVYTQFEREPIIVISFQTLFYTIPPIKLLKKRQDLFDSQIILSTVTSEKV